METMLLSHSADLQVKVRNVNLYRESLYTLQYMEKFIEEHKISIHVITGDLFEYPTPNDDERRLIYNHLVRLLNIPTLKLLIVIDGNHDLEKENKIKLTASGNNALSTISSIIETLEGPYKNKLKYMRFSTIYSYENIDFLPYCLTNKENWGELKYACEKENNGKLRIALYHAMIADYAKDKGLPIKLDKLDTLDIFPSNTVVLAGDIHESYSIKDIERNVNFIYPGAPMIHTFGEGSYINIGEELVPKYGKQKKFNVFKIDSNMQVATEMQLAEIFIPKYIQYLTIQLDSSVDYSVLKHNLQQISWGTLCSEQTCRVFVKIKSSNILIKQEQEIFDIIKNMCPVSDVIIQFEYDKLIQKDTYSDNPIIKEIIETNIASSENIQSDCYITSENIDNLLLNKEQLTKLFDTSANQMLSKIDLTNSSDIRKELLELFDKQLSMCMEQSSQRFDTKFQSVECNNFMILKDVFIDLTEKGITRILGTNGIGKTTLYRLIRWTLTGTVMEGMKSNQVVQNSLPVFNKNLPDKNLITGCLKLIVNNHPIKITRSVSRIWKKNITEEQKLSQNWYDFVSEVNRELVLEIYEKSFNEETPRKFSGDNAELLIKRYLGNTIDNLLFIDHTKIKQILTTPANLLNETILDYIGVDYLRKLEANLDGVKEDLMSISKPKIDKESVRENIIDTEIKINKTTADIEAANVLESTLQTKIDLNKKSLEETNQKLEDIGNVEIQLENKKSEKEALESKINEFTKLEPKQKPIFDKEEPKKNTEVIESHKKLIETYINKRKELENRQESIMSVFKTNQANLHNYIAVVNNGLNSRLIEINKLIEQNTNDFNTIATYIKRNLSDTLQKLNDKFQEKFEEKIKFSSRLNEIEKELNSLKDQLNNGYCPTCKRQYDDFTDEIKNKISLKIRDFVSEKNSTEESINEINEWIEKFNNVKDKYTNYYKLCSIETFDEFKNSGIIGFDEEIRQMSIHLSSNLTANFNKKEIELKQQLANKEFQLLLNDINHEINESIITDNLISIITKIKESSKEYDDITEQIKKNVHETNEVNEYITNLESDYVDKFNYYKLLYNKWQKECEEIDKYNLDIQEKINSQTNSKLKLLDIIDEITNLEKNKLPEYNKYKELQTNLLQKQSEYQDELKHNNTEITRLKLLENSLQNQKENKQKEYDNILKYERNQIIWKIYSKLVKTNFKEIVFEYYRSFLNNTLNHLLSDVSFKLYWNSDSQLTMINQKNGIVTYQPVQFSSGMETTFLGLSLIYCMHLLNVKNSISHLFIDEISGTLNKGKELSYVAENYQELFVKILFKFKDKSVFIVDHTIDEIRDCMIYEVIPQENYSIYVKR